MKTNTCLIPTFLTILMLLSVHADAQNIAAGQRHSVHLCANNNPGTFGYNANGQLGDGTTVDRSNETAVAALTNVIAVSAGRAHTLFLKNDGTVWSCGSNTYGQMGLGVADVINHSTPVQLPSLSGIIAIAAGANHSLFLKNDSTVWSCGYNVRGELGDGTYNQSGAPIKINSLSGIIALAAGGTHSIFLKKNGTVWACGRNVEGQIGVGTTGLNPLPVQVNILSGITAIAGGGFFSLYLKNDGTVWACGQNMAGQLGDGTSTDRSTPVQSTSLSGMIAIAAGGNHSLFLKNDNTVWATGYNGTGQLGIGNTISKTTPVQIVTLSGITEIAAGGDLATGKSHSVFMKNDGSVLACGDNTVGQLGDGTNTQNTSPIQLTTLCTVTSVKENNFEKTLIYPNPSAGAFKIDISEDNFPIHIEIINALGQTKYSTSVSVKDNSIETADLPSGIYTVRISNNTKTSNTTFIKL